MITKSKAFTTSDGNTYATLEIAQRAELLKLVMEDNIIDDPTKLVDEAQANPVLQRIFDHLDEVKDILRATGRKPRKAKAAVATRKRKASVKEAE